MHAHTHSGTYTLAAPWASNGTLAGWASTCPVSPAKSKLMCSHTYKIPLDVPAQPPATVLQGYLTKLSTNSKYFLISMSPEKRCQWPLFYCCNWTPQSDYCYYTALVHLNVIHLPAVLAAIQSSKCTWQPVIHIFFGPRLSCFSNILEGLVYHPKVDASMHLDPEVIYFLA